VCVCVCVNVHTHTLTHSHTRTHILGHLRRVATTDCVANVCVAARAQGTGHVRGCLISDGVCMAGMGRQRDSGKVEGWQSSRCGSANISKCSGACVVITKPKCEIKKGDSVTVYVLCMSTASCAAERRRIPVAAAARQMTLCCVFDSTLH
jgi:hypothetical protein